MGRWVLVSTILASGMAFIDGTALNVALPQVQAALGASGAQLLWIVNGYLLMLAALVLVGGSLGDILGRKRVFMMGIGLFVMASLACGLAPTVEFMIAARAVEGIGGALMIPGSLSIITAFFGPEQRGRAIGTWSSVTTIVTVAGPVLGGLLAGAGLWRGVFLINLPLGIAALYILYTRVPESRDEQASGRIDYAGAALAVIGLAGVTYGFTSAPNLGFGDPTVLASLIVGPVLAGLGFLIMGFAGLTQGPSQYWTTFFPGVVVLGAGMGITVAPLTTAVMNSVATHLSGTASGINNAVARTAGVLAIAVAGALALFLFAVALRAHTASIDLPDTARAALEAQSSRLGAAAVPPEVPAGSAAAIATAIKLAFVDTFRTVMWMCAALAWLGAALAGIFVEGRPTDR